MASQRVTSESLILSVLGGNHFIAFPSFRVILPNSLHLPPLLSQVTSCTQDDIVSDFTFRGPQPE
jgi:hypothetical protein